MSTLSITVLIASIVIAIVLYSTPSLFFGSSETDFIPNSTGSEVSQDKTSIMDASRYRMPTYFLGIGGPNFTEARDHPAFTKLGEVGKEITSKVKPKAVVVFSAHWQYEKSTLGINVAEEMDLIYDFYGFPSHYYEYKYPNKGSCEVAERAIDRLSEAGMKVQRVHRGLDHGVWVGFLAAFDPHKNPLNVPIVQVSMLGNEDPTQHYRIGQALQSLRDEGMLIIGAGMAVHNPQHYRASRGSKVPKPYTSSFENAITNAVTTTPDSREAAMMAVLKRSDASQAHPTMEHLLPLYVAAGAAGSDKGERVWELAEGSLNWAQYRFGNVPEGKLMRRQIVRQHLKRLEPSLRS